MRSGRSDSGRPDLLCRTVTKLFDGREVINGVSANFSSHEITAVIGPNGAGKTVLLDLISGYIRCDSGSIHWGNHDLGAKKPNEIAKIGLHRTFQEVRLIRTFSAIHNIAFAERDNSSETLWHSITRRGLSNQEATQHEKALDLLSSFDLDHKAWQLCEELSHGERKLVSLAAAFASNADLILLDEPFSGVSDSMMVRATAAIRDAAREGRMFVIVEHNLEAIRATADRIVMLNRGQVVADDSTDSILDNQEIMNRFLQ